MSVVPEEIVEKAWRELSELGPDDMNQIRMLTELQPNLLAFVLSMSDDLGEEAQESGIFVYTVLIYAFHMHAGVAMAREIQPEQIEAVYNRVVDRLEGLEGVDDDFFERAAETQGKLQPFVMAYLLDALFDGEEDPEDTGEDLTEDEQGALFVTLQTVIEILDEATGSTIVVAPR